MSSPADRAKPGLTLVFGAIARNVLANAVSADRDPVPRHAFGHRLPAPRFREPSSPGVADAWNGRFPPAAVPYCARTTSATPERSTATALSVRISASVPAASPADRIASASVAARSVKVTVILSVPTELVLCRSYRPLSRGVAGRRSRIEAPATRGALARARDRARSSARPVRCTSAPRAPVVTCSDVQAGRARAGSAVLKAAPPVSVWVRRANRSAMSLRLRRYADAVGIPFVSQEVLRIRGAVRGTCPLR